MGLSSRQSFTNKNQYWIFGLLLTLQAALLAFSFYLEKDLAQQINHYLEINRLGILGYQFSEESYYTQLELWEYAYEPTSERLTHFYRHQEDYSKKYEAFHKAFFELNPEVSSETLEAFRRFPGDIERIHQEWEHAIQSIQTHDSKEAKKAFLLSEKTIDELKFNLRIKNILKELQKSNEKFLSSITDLYLKNSLIMAFIISTFLILFFTYRHIAIDKEKLLQNQLIQAEKLSSLGQISAGVAHELNNPLMFITGFSHRIKVELENLGVHSEKITDYLSEIENGAFRISKIINHLKDFARKSDSQHHILDPNAVIRKSFELFQEQLQIHNIELQLSFCSNPIPVMGNPTRLEQVFLNLISNAKDALKEEKESPRVISVVTRSSSKKVTIDFWNSGKGMDPDHAKKAFDPFFTTKPAGVGTGLGLSIVHEIIQEHGGTIQIDSHPKKGTRFIIELPLQSIAISKNS